MNRATDHWGPHWVFMWKDRESFKANANYKKAKSAKTWIWALCLLAYIQAIYLQTLSLCDSTTVRHDRTKNTLANMMIKATLKRKVFNTWLKGILVTSWPKLLSYHLSWGSEMLVSCELCPLWCCSSLRKCSYPRQRGPPWQCKGFPSAGRRNADCLVEQSMGTHWRPMHK